jgi:hypothetical protein
VETQDPRANKINNNNNDNNNNNNKAATTKKSSITCLFGTGAEARK